MTAVAPGPVVPGPVVPGPVVPVPPDPTPWLAEAAGWCADRPWLAAAVIAAAAGAVTVRAWLARRWERRLVRGARLLTIHPPPQVDPAGAAVFWATMAAVLRHRLGRRSVPVGFEYRWTGRRLTVAVWLPGPVPTGPVLAAIRGAWPGAAGTVTDADPPLPAAAAVADGAAMTPVLPAWYLLHTSHQADPVRTLTAAAGQLGPTDAACVQIVAQPATGRQHRRLRAGVTALRAGRPTTGGDPTDWVRAAVSAVLDLLTPGPRTRTTTSAGGRPPSDPVRDRDARAALDKLTATGWHTTIRVGVAHTGRPGSTPPDQLPARLQSTMAGLQAGFGAWTGRNRLRPHPLRHPAAVLAARRLRRGFLLADTELASLAALPTDVAVPGLDRARATPRPAPVTVPAGGRTAKVLGRADVGGHAVAVPVADARQHIHVIGSTGSGKSTLLLNMILDDIHAKRGTIVIDPKGDLVVDLLDRIPTRYADRLVIIDPDQPAGTTLNPLQGDDHDLVVDNIVSIFGRIFAKHWGPRIDDTLRVACLTLLRKTNATLTLIPPLLNDRQFRYAFTQDLDDPEGLRGFWEWFESTPPPLRAQVIGPVLARLRAFLLRDFVRRTLGHPHSSFDMRRILDGGILLCRLPKGQLGDDTARLMGSFVVASAWQAATARTRTPEHQRRDAFAYIDEAHNFLTLPGSVADMLAEARGYRLGLVLAHQNLTQLPRDTQQALSANARNKIFFACAPEDAHQLARHTQPELTEHDLAHLDAHRAACRLLINNQETAAFTLHTNPPRPAIGDRAELRRLAAARQSTAPAAPAPADTDQPAR